MDKQNRDNRTIISNADGIVIATQKEWNRLQADDLTCLNGYIVVRSMISTGSVYFILRNMNPESWCINHDKYQLLKVTTDEETGKVDFFIIELNEDEAELINDTPLPLWE